MKHKILSAIILSVFLLNTAQAAPVKKTKTISHIKKAKHHVVALQKHNKITQEKNKKKLEIIDDNGENYDNPAYY